jgi:hypothetical protein
LGWPLIEIRTQEVFERSKGVLDTKTTLVKEVLEKESEHYFTWQYDAKASCPKGCGRAKDGEMCLPTVAQKDEL